MTTGVKIIIEKWYDAVRNQWRWKCQVCGEEHGTTCIEPDYGACADTAILEHLDRAHRGQEYEIISR